ncbi:YkvA family protein [Spirosoma radiotolerans]|uniref:DUF1232 domain-containing protein n=1 Tax=Spirosoma radiotolerans TaxID=1379870 RepID=A0A0E3ZY83_9BACT|nr:YkvA family protein [Spirosoma radiotolerans]AKD57548.1 hypothetical protein SD10_24285 [Spirosoma radiotolerans]
MANSSLISRILSSIFFKRANVGAVRYARNSRSLFQLVKDALAKSGGLSGNNIAAFREQLGVVTRLIRAYASGEYRQLPWKTLTSIVAVLLYFVNPLDIIPDILPIVGFADDIALVGWLFSSMGSDIEKFRQWEQTTANSTETNAHPPKTIKIG